MDDYIYFCESIALAEAIHLSLKYGGRCCVRVDPTLEISVRFLTCRFRESLGRHVGPGHQELPRFSTLRRTKCRESELESRTPRTGHVDG